MYPEDRLSDSVHSGRVAGVCAAAPRRRRGAATPRPAGGAGDVPTRTRPRTGDVERVRVVLQNLLLLYSTVTVVVES